MTDPAKKVHGQIKSILGDRSEVVGVQGRDIVDVGSGIRAIVSTLVGEVSIFSLGYFQWNKLMRGTNQDWVDRSGSRRGVVEDPERMYVLSNLFDVRLISSSDDYITYPRRPGYLTICLGRNYIYHLV